MPIGSWFHQLALLTPCTSIDLNMPSNSDRMGLLVVNPRNCEVSSSLLTIPTYCVVYQQLLFSSSASWPVALRPPLFRCLEILLTMIPDRRVHVVGMLWLGFLPLASLLSCVLQSYLCFASLALSRTHARSC